MAAKQFREQILSICDDFRLKVKDLKDSNRFRDTLSEATLIKADSIGVRLLADAEHICDTLAGVSSHQIEEIVALPLGCRDPPLSISRYQSNPKNIPEQLRRISLGQRGKSDLGSSRNISTACAIRLHQMIRQKHSAQLDRHIDRCWTILRESLAPPLSVPSFLESPDQLHGHVAPCNFLNKVLILFSSVEEVGTSSAGVLLTLLAQHTMDNSASPKGHDSSYAEQDPLSPFDDLEYPPSDHTLDSYSTLPSPDACGIVPGLWLVKVGADVSRIVEGNFVIEHEFAASWDLLPGCGLNWSIWFLPDSCRPSSGTAIKSRLSVALLRLPTGAVISVYNLLKPTNPTPGPFFVPLHCRILRVYHCSASVHPGRTPAPRQGGFRRCFLL
ncbi:hypothetical protein B0H14DRAFT_2578190 [Mycena olivaceomarginata]|nr:hypothetical protein B0H14DRAFT_2578190 [Mycena olivaceomarginata]